MKRGGRHRQWEGPVGDVRIPGQRPGRRVEADLAHVVGVGGLIGLDQHVIALVGLVDERVEQQERPAGVALLGSGPKLDRGRPPGQRDASQVIVIPGLKTTPATPASVATAVPVMSWMSLVATVPLTVTWSDQV
jgi:hypothetical protein